MNMKEAGKCSRLFHIVTLRKFSIQTLALKSPLAFYLLLAPIT
jgi:hypothetical protein